MFNIEWTGGTPYDVPAVTKKERINHNFAVEVHILDGFVCFKSLTAHELRKTKSWLECLPKVIKTWDNKDSRDYITRWCNHGRLKINQNFSHKVVDKLEETFCSYFEFSNVIDFLVEVDKAYTLIHYLSYARIKYGTKKVSIPYLKSLGSDCAIAFGPLFIDDEQRGKNNFHWRNYLCQK